ncbi:MAG TPA: carboxymuconolactone decarboxylase family protein [Gammaproteobacteria bacterium]|jgi:4-carboxymuconolactone decarboxylase
MKHQLFVLGRLAILTITFGTARLGLGQDRMPAIPEQSMAPSQLAAIEELRRARGIEVRGPWIPLLRSPELMNRARTMGDYLRYGSALPPRLSEFLILLTARAWTQQYEWQAHRDVAVEAGIDARTVEAIAAGRVPEPMDDEQAALHALFTELHHDRAVSDTTYERALSLVGERGIVDAVGIIGYYTLLAMVMNTARTALPAGAEPELESLP